MLHGALFLHEQGEDIRKRDDEPTLKLEAFICKLRGKTAVKKILPKKAIGVVAVQTQEGSDLPVMELLRSPPLIPVIRLLVWHFKHWTGNILMRNRKRGSLPLARRRKGMTGYPKLCGFNGLAHQTYRNIML